MHPPLLLRSQVQHAHPTHEVDGSIRVQKDSCQQSMSGCGGVFTRGLGGIQTHSSWLKKKEISTAAVAAASEPWMALRSMFSP
jgi:hypothetical protein